MYAGVEEAGGAAAVQEGAIIPYAEFGGSAFKKKPHTQIQRTGIKRLHHTSRRSAAWNSACFYYPQSFAQQI